MKKLSPAQLKLLREAVNAADERRICYRSVYREPTIVALKRLGLIKQIPHPHTLHGALKPTELGRETLKQYPTE